MSDLNSWTASGKLARDPEYRETKNGKGFAKGSFCSNERYKTAQGEWTDKPTWINFVIWGGLARKFSEVFKKGDTVVVSGRFESSKSDDGRVWSQMNVRDFVWKDRRRNESPDQGGFFEGGDTKPATNDSFPDDVPF